jgi:hypothetical protein
MKVEPQKEHQWLQALVGEWTHEMEAQMGPDKPPEKFQGSETVRSLGGLWVLCESRVEVPGGGVGTTLMTLGFDPRTKRFVGTFVGSMGTHMWVYNGALDAAERVLTLDCEGPDFSTEGKMTSYKDAIEIVSDDQRVLTSQMLAADGSWLPIMTQTYRRKK